jgi:hypothetical protein
MTSGQYMESNSVVHTGEVEVTIVKNKYGTGDAEVIVKYRHASAAEDVSAASWTTYTDPFESLGYVQVRVEVA